MDEQQIRQIVQQEIQKSSNSSRFNVNSVPQIKINSLNTSNTPSTVFTYIGFVPYDGNIAGILEVILPLGWTVTHNGTGNYTVTHNLGTILYSVVASAAQSTNVKVSTVTTANENDVTFSWWDETGAAQDTSFNFILTQISNKRTTFPLYYQHNT